MTYKISLLTFLDNSFWRLDVVLANGHAGIFFTEFTCVGKGFFIKKHIKKQVSTRCRKIVNCEDRLCCNYYRWIRARVTIFGMVRICKNCRSYDCFIVFLCAKSIHSDWIDRLRWAVSLKWNWKCEMYSLSTAMFYCLYYGIGNDMVDVKEVPFLKFCLLYADQMSRRTCTICKQRFTGDRHRCNSCRHRVKKV